MRFNYFLPWLPETGTGKKILSQVNHLKKLGLEADIFAINFNNSNQKIQELKSIDHFFDEIFHRIIRAIQTRKKFSEAIASSGPEDIVYFRGSIFQLIYYPLNYFRHFRKCKLVTEHQTIEVQEYLLLKNYSAYLRNIIFRSILLKQVDGIVGVTDQITDYEIMDSSLSAIPHITIGNGFDINSVYPRTAPRYNQTELVLLCVANVNRWHGLDRIIAGIASYSGSVSLKLHIAGIGGEIPYLKKLIEKMGIKDKVIFHGFVSGKALDKLFDQCHIAVGSLGIHRKGLSQTSELKVREYCARGIPYIIACSDPDFPDDFPYFLRLPSDESSIDMKQVIVFTSRMCQDSGHPQKMRQYALENLDWSIKMKKLKQFLENLR